MLRANKMGRIKQMLKNYFAKEAYPQISAGLTIVRPDFRYFQGINPRGVKEELLEITPELAKFWLDNHNGFNRNEKLDFITGGIKDMKNGYWDDEVNLIFPIVFCTDRHLGDGQNRLEVVKQSKITKVWKVVYEASTSIRSSIDTGTPRSIRDIIKLRGVEVNPSLGGVANIVLGKGSWRRRVSKQEQSRLQLTLKEPVDWVFSNFPHGNVKGLRKGCVLGPFVRAWYTQDRTELARMLRVFGTMVPEYPYDQNLIKLRDIVTGLKKHPALQECNTPHEADTTIYKLVENTIVHVLDKRVVKQLHPASKELFPIPQDKDRS
jgi:hypothetical protein